MSLADAEVRLGISLPRRHRDAMLDPSDPIHDACNFLVPSSPYELLRWVEVNECLHGTEQSNQWPAFLVAFASNGCGDYFAYDLRCEPPAVIYMDPDYTVEENLTADDRLSYPSFEAWYASQLGSTWGRTGP